MIATLGLVLASHLAPQSAMRYVRVNQVGYPSTESKRAVVFGTAPSTGQPFAVLDSEGRTVLHGTVGPAGPSWSKTFGYTNALDFSALQVTGTYTIAVGSGANATVSVPLRIDTPTSLYVPLIPNAEFFYEAQRDGSDVNSSVLKRKPSHLADEQAFAYDCPLTCSLKPPVGTLLQLRLPGTRDASGGWADAGDYLKFVQTASYTEAVMLLGLRDYGALTENASVDFASESVRGLTWLSKMFDDASGTLYYQVGLGTDGGGYHTDHDFWRLPEYDDALPFGSSDTSNHEYFVKYRPLLRAGPAGSPVSPNLAGRLAAGFALCYQVFHANATHAALAKTCLTRAQHVFALADTNPSKLLTSAPHNFYPETEWRDDLEWGATELALAAQIAGSPSPHDAKTYLQAAAMWAHRYLTDPKSGDGTDTLNLYDVSGLAHVDLISAIASIPHGSLDVTSADVLRDLGAQVQSGVVQASKDPFGLGFAYNNGDVTPHALGLALEASLYDQLANTTAYQVFARTQRDFVFGLNAWGSSFVVGAGARFPYCMQHQIANLIGSTNGSAPIMLGATVDGPNQKSSFSGGLGLPTSPQRPVKCPPDGSDPWKIFTSKGARYWDDTRAYPSVEPTDDYTALTILLEARSAQSRL